MSTNYISRVMLHDMSHPAMGEETLGLVLDRLFSMIERLEKRITELEATKVAQSLDVTDLQDIKDRLDDLESKIDDKIEKYDFRSEVEDVIRDLSFSISID